MYDETYTDMCQVYHDMMLRNCDDEYEQIHMSHTRDVARVMWRMLREADVKEHGVELVRVWRDTPPMLVWFRFLQEGTVHLGVCVAPYAGGDASVFLDEAAFEERVHRHANEFCANLGDDLTLTLLQRLRLVRHVLKKADGAVHTISIGDEYSCSDFGVEQVSKRSAALSDDDRKIVSLKRFPFESL